MGKHPTSGQPLEGWSKVGDGTEGLQEGFPLGVPLREETRAKEEKEGGGDMIPNEGSGVKDKEEAWEDDTEDWGLWMDQGRDQEEEEHLGDGFLGFDDP